MVTAIKYTDAIGDWTVRDAPLQDYLAYQAAQWGRTTRCEFLQHGTRVVPYFDFDSTQASPYTPQQLADAWDLCHRTIMTVFGTDPDFDFDTRVAHAHRHGLVPAKALHKISFRFWIRGFSILPEHMPVLIKATAPPELQDVFDLSIYSARRLLAVVGGIKGDGDHRVLEVDDPTTAQWCICQRLEGNEIDLDLASEVEALKRNLKGSTATAPEDWDALETLLMAAGFQDPLYRGRRQLSVTFTAANLGMDCPCCPWVHDSQDWWVMQRDDGSHLVKNYSARCKTMHLSAAAPVVEDITPITPGTPVEQTLAICLNNMGFANMGGGRVVPGGCFVLKQHLEHCPTCRKAHAQGSSYLVETAINQCYTVRNIEQTCQSRIISIEHMVEQHEVLSRILQNPTLDSPLADLYVAERGHNLTATEADVFRFQDNRWSVFKTPDLENDVRAFLEKVLPAIMALLRHEEDMVQSANVRADVRRLQKLRAGFSKAVDVPRSGPKRKQMVTTIKTQLHDGKLEDLWDSKPHLGLENGLVDLDTCRFRPARKDDYVTMSCGYDWVETVDPEVEAQVENFFQKVYPVEDERALFQQWAGYCLTADHREKLLLLLTDRRSGFNAKSTVLSLLADTMGDYAIKGDAALYYANDKQRTVNDHSAGLMTYEKKRLLFIEETSSSRVLDSSVVKDLNGGNPTMAGRGMYQNSIKAFPWITKTTIAFNENRLPAVDVDDAALMERFMAIPHRSRFFAGEVPDEPYSYPADSTIKEKFRLWRPYVLRWALRGLQMYRQHRFRNIPDSCRNFMSSIVEEKDTVKEFLTNAIEAGDSKDFVKVKELYNDYSDAYRALQKDKKTFKNSGSFQTGVARVLKKDAFVKRHNYYTSAAFRRCPGCLPQFDFSDRAMIDRFIVLQHRSKFCASVEEYEAEKNVPYTFMADPDMATKMRDLRPYTLRWFLEGVHRYQQVGFGQMPSQCLAWKDDLVKTHDTVGTFVSEHLQKTDVETDFVQRSHLYQVYRDVYPEEKNPKTNLGKHKWFDQMKKHLGDEADERGLGFRDKYTTNH